MIETRTERKITLPVKYFTEYRLPVEAPRTLRLTHTLIAVACLKHTYLGSQILHRSQAAGRVDITISVPSVVRISSTPVTRLSVRYL